MRSDFAYNNAEFDEYAADYDRALAEGLSVSGEDKNFFARGRIAWLAERLRQIGEHPRSILDFGCGVGSAAPFLIEMFDPDSITGVDISEMSLAAARKINGSDRVNFFSFDQYQPDTNIDLAFCNGVFHHIPVDDRRAAVSYIYRSLRPGGLFALWENNPWNPGTRLVMSRIPFDRDAVTLSPPETRGLLSEVGFKILGTDFLFIFPRMLRWFRRLEPALARLPFGAQYQVLCRKPQS